jgi:hypothetical protein
VSHGFLLSKLSKSHFFAKIPCRILKLLFFTTPAAGEQQEADRIFNFSTVLAHRSNELGKGSLAQEKRNGTAKRQSGKTPFLGDGNAVRQEWSG